METKVKIKITVQTAVKAPVDKVWKMWREPEHIKKWNNASDDWHTPTAENDLRTGGQFTSRMEARDGSMGFDFAGVYDEVKKHEVINYTMGDDRKVWIRFSEKNDQIEIVETFEAESENSVEMQKGGWQSILDNFKKYVESTK